MKLSVKGPNGKVEVFDEVDNWSFSVLRQQVNKRFALNRDFALLFGNRQLPTDNSKLVESELGLVSGDRLRVVVSKKGPPPSDRVSTSSGIPQETEEGSSSGSTEINGSIFDMILSLMKREGFERIKHEDGGTRWKFRHPNSVLIVELDFRVYNDKFKKYIHATASIYHPSGRRFLEPVVLEEKSNDLQKKVSECLIAPLKLALLGHENPFLRLLGNTSVAESLFELLPAKSILRLERTNKYALEVCRSERMERIWKILYERDFGRDTSAVRNQTYREAYKRKYVELVRQRENFRDLTDPNFGIPVRPSFPNPPFRPEIPDPDIPEGPFNPLPRNPFIPPENPFPSPSGPLNPLDPFRGGELLPNRPFRPSGIPRQIPRGPRFPDGGYHGFI